MPPKLASQISNGGKPTMQKSYADASSPSTKVAKRVFGLTDTTMRRLLSQPKPSNLIALYVFLLHTANRQRTQCVYATVPFIARGLGWSEAKVKLVKKRLRDLSLIEAVRRRDDTGQLTGHFVRVRFLTSAAEPEAKKTSQWCDEPQMLEHKNTNALRKKGKGVFNTSSSSRKEASEELISEDFDEFGEPVGESSVGEPPSYDEFNKFAEANELDENFVQAFWDQHQRDGWRIPNRLTGKLEPIRNWRRALLAFCEKLEADRDVFPL